MNREQINRLLNEQHTIILDRQSRLSATDYIDNKIVEKVATIEDYADKIADRQEWRNEINAAQEEIKRLKALEPEEDTPEPTEEAEQ